MPQTPKFFEIFLEVVTKSFLGERMQYGKKIFNLEPAIPRAYDFLKKIKSPQNEFERLLSNLEPNFKSAAKTEIYRKKTGWLARGVAEERIRLVTDDGDTHIIPVLRPRRTVGIDSSTVGNSMSVMVFAFIADYDLGPVYFDKHLGLRKGTEFKWAFLRSYEKELSSKAAETSTGIYSSF